MAGTLITNSLDLGDHATATNNFQLRTNQDGTASLIRKGTDQSILTVDANGRIAMPQTVVAFSAYQSVAHSLANAVTSKVTMAVEEFDTASLYDTATSRFTSTVAGYYQIDAAVLFAANSTGVRFCEIWKNGTGVKRGNQGQGAAGGETASTVSALVYLNGSTDYVEVYAYQGSGAALDTFAGQVYTYFQGHLVAKA